jgi:hypothetical protein
METLYTWLISDLKQHPVVICLVLLILWRQHDFADKLKRLCHDFTEHLLRSARD